MIYRHYTTDDGLVQNQVISMYQDSKGFLWLGTKAGISRFDGKVFRNYRFNKEMPVVSFFEFIEDENNSIGIVSHRKLYKLSNDTFRYVRPLFNSSIQTNYSINHIFKKGKLSITSAVDNYNFIALWLDKKNADTVSLEIEHGLSHNTQRQNYISSDNDYIYLTASDNDSIIIIQKEDKKVGRVSKRSMRIEKMIVSGQPFAIDINKYVCRLYKNKLKPLFLLPDELSDERIIIVNEFDDGGFMVYTHRTQNLFLFSSDRTFKGKIPLESISCMIRDFQKNIWIGGENGLYCINNPGIQRIEQGIPHVSGVWNLISDGSKMWIANFSPSLLRYYENGKVYEDNTYRFVDGNGVVKPGTLYMGGTTDWRKRPVFTTPDIGIIRKEEKGWKRFLANENYDAMFVYNDSMDKRTLAGTAKGLMIVDEMDNVRFISPEKIHPNKGRIVSITKDHTGNYLLGAFSFLRFWDGKDKIWSLPDSIFPAKMGANAMCKDAKGVWIGNNMGLYYYNGKTFVKIHHPRLDDFVTALYNSGDSLLFIGSLKGLSVIKLKKFHSENSLELFFYDRWNGFTGREVQQNGIAADNLGRVWVATNDNIHIIDTRFLRFNHNPPTVYLDKLSWLDDNMRWMESQTNRSVSFTYAQRNIRIDYLGINFSSPERMTFQHFLKGYDNDWSILTNETYAVYTNLPPGKYSFILKAANENGVSSDPVEIIEFEVEAAFWQKWWFYSLIVIFIAGSSMIITTIIGRRAKKAREKELKIKFKMADLQLRSIRSQMDPHFTFNAINSIGAAILKNDKDMALKYLQNLSKLIRSTLDHSNKMTRFLTQEVEFVRHYLELEKFRFGDRFDYTIETDSLADESIKVPKMIIQTYAENSLKHGILSLPERRGFIKIQISKNNGLLTIKVEDNGIGRVAAAEHSAGNTRRGLKIMDQYFDLFKEHLSIEIKAEFTDLYDKYGQASGTRVVITMPVIE